MSKANKNSIQEIDLVDIDLDTRNFRIGAQDSQRAAIKAIISQQKKKLVNLASDIIDFQLSPTDFPMVYKAAGGRYVVVEGNRRITALKLLTTPELAKETPLESDFRQLAVAFKENPITKVTCAVLESRQAALPWISRKHASGLEGRGTEAWESLAKMRYDQDAGKEVPALKVIEWVRETSDDLDPDVVARIDSGDYPATNIERLIGDQTFKRKLKLSIVDGAVKSNSSETWTRNVLKQIVEIVGRGKGLDGETFNVRNIEDTKLREDFADQILNANGQPPEKKKGWVLGEEDHVKAAAPQSSSATKSAPTSKTRNRLVPKDCRIQLPEGKINDLFKEMRELPLDTFTNSAAVVFRVFLEHTVDAYYLKFSLQVRGRDTLHNKITAVNDHVAANKVMTDKELKGISVDLAKPDSLIHPDTLHAYVHNPSFTARADDLKATFDRYRIYLERLWKAVNAPQAGHP